MRGIPKQENVFFLGMIKEPKVTNFIIQISSKCFIAEMPSFVKMIKCLSQIQIIRLMTITAVDFSNCEVPPRSSQLTCQLLNPLLEGQNEKATSRFMERANACT